MSQAGAVGRTGPLGQAGPARERYRAPRECPVCADRLQVTQLGCEACGTGISGSFESCDFCALDAADLDVLRVFLSSRGNMKELERHLGVSYPTARARYDEMVRKLGLVTRSDADPGTGPASGPAAPPTSTPGSTTPGSTTLGSTSAASTPAASTPAASTPAASTPAASTSGSVAGDPSDRLGALRALANGELDIDQARRLITG